MKPVRVMRLVLLAAGAMACLSAVPAVNQTTPQPHGLPATTVIDGAKTPQLISDDKAWEVLFETNKLPATASAIEKTMIADRFSRASLGSADMNALLAALSAFDREVMQLNDKAVQLQNEGARQEEFTRLDHQFHQLVADSRLQLAKTMTKTGFARLTVYVSGMKRNIKVYRNSTLGAQMYSNQTVYTDASVSSITLHVWGVTYAPSGTSAMHRYTAQTTIVMPSGRTITGSYGSGSGYSAAQSDAYMTLHDTDVTGADGDISVYMDSTAYCPYYHHGAVSFLPYSRTTGSSPVKQAVEARLPPRRGGA